MIGCDDIYKYSENDIIFDINRLIELNSEIKISPNYYVSTIGADGVLSEMFPQIYTHIKNSLDNIGILSGYSFEVMDNATSVFITLVAFMKELYGDKLHFILPGLSYADNTRALDNYNIKYTVYDINDDNNCINIDSIVLEEGIQYVLINTPLCDNDFDTQYDKLLNYCTNNNIILFDDLSLCISSKSKADFKYFSTGGQKVIPVGWGGILLMKEKYSDSYASNREILLDKVLHAVNISVFNLFHLIMGLEKYDEIVANRNVVYNHYSTNGLELTFLNPVGMYQLQHVGIDEFIKEYEESYSFCLPIAFKRNILVPNDEFSNLFIDMSHMDIKPQNTYKLAKSILCLPVTYGLSKNDVKIIKHVVKSIDKKSD